MLLEGFPKGSSNKHVNIPCFDPEHVYYLSRSEVHAELTESCDHQGAAKPRLVDEFNGFVCVQAKALYYEMHHSCHLMLLPTILHGLIYNMSRESPANPRFFIREALHP